MNCIVLACGSLVEYVRAAQKKLGTAYPEVYLDKSLHADPSAMRRSIIEKLASLPAEYDTVLVAMGFCGGSWRDVKTDRRVVRPAVDDCVSLLLHTAARAGYNLKRPAHLYMKDVDPTALDMARIFAGYTKDMEPAERERTKAAWRAGYSVIDVVDTGLNDCHTAAYQEQAERNAAWIGGSIEHLTGSNILIEKLLAGDWDPQLFVVEQPSG